MSGHDDTRDRLIRLESEVEHMTKTVASMATKVEAMHSILMQAKGAKYVIVASAAVGGFVSAKLAPFMPWFGK